MKKVIYKVVSNAHERKMALDFIERWGRKWHGCSPPLTTGEIIIAYEESEIIGTVSLDFFNYRKQFALEKIYDFSYLKLYFPFIEKENIVQGGRWFASKQGISRMLLHAIAEYSIPRGAEYLIAEVKETSLKRLEELGIRFAILYGVAPNLETIPKKGLKYYTDLPPPRLMIIKLSLLYIEEKTILI